MRPFLFLGAVRAFVVVGGWALVAATAVHAAGPVRFTSGPARVSLVELYTSEGCSSCPPAERWMAGLREAPGLWRDFVPVAFHVDYWNRLGWPDRFASREFTQREYAYAAAWGSQQVYTPCFVRDGAEWRTREMPRALAAAASAAAGTLTVTYDGAKVRADFVAANAAGAAGAVGARGGEPVAYEMHAVILGAGIGSKVTAGENRGETLRHEFVALRLVQGEAGRDVALAVPSVAGVPRHALAVWITRRGSLVPVQAAGGWLE